MRSRVTPRVQRTWSALSMNPLGPQREKVGESRSVTLWETNSSVRRPLRPFQVGSGLDRHSSYLNFGRDLPSLASSFWKMMSAAVRTQYRNVTGVDSLRSSI